MERLPSTVHEKRQFDGHYSGNSSTETAVFMDGGQILKVPSTESRVFVDGTKIFERRGLTDRIK